MNHRPYSSEPIYIGPDPPRRSPNGWGISGFVISLLSLVFTLGLLCPLGLLISLVGMLRAPRGFALAGTMLGLLGTLFWAAIGFGVYSSVKHEEQLVRHRHETQQTLAQFTAVEQKLAEYRIEQGRLPKEMEGARIAVRFKDGWDRPLRYEVRKSRIIIRSGGPDGNFETRDDMVRVISANRREVEQVAVGDSSSESSRIEIDSP